MDELLIKAISERLASTSYQLCELNWENQQGNKTLQLMCAKDDLTMDLDGCVEVSNIISELLDEQFPQLDNYYLEVCSPGAERELKDDNARLASLGKHVYVRLAHPQNKALEFIGDIIAVEDNQFTLQYNDKGRIRKVNFPLQDIEFMRLAVKI